MLAAARKRDDVVQLWRVIDVGPTFAARRTDATKLAQPAITLEHTDRVDRLDCDPSLARFSGQPMDALVSSTPSFCAQTA